MDSTLPLRILVTYHHASRFQTGLNFVFSDVINLAVSSNGLAGLRNYWIRATNHTQIGVTTKYKYTIISIQVPVYKMVGLRVGPPKLHMDMNILRTSIIFIIFWNIIILYILDNSKSWSKASIVKPTSCAWNPLPAALPKAPVEILQPATVAANDCVHCPTVVTDDWGCFINLY